MYRKVQHSMKPLDLNLATVARRFPGANQSRRIESWYLTYTLLGAAMGGMVPILAPLLILKRLGSPIYVGMVMAAYNLGGLIAPLWGRLADRFQIHRSLLVISLRLTATGLMAFTRSCTRPLLFGLALIQGVGTAGAMTLGNLFIVEVSPGGMGCTHRLVSDLQLQRTGRRYAAGRHSDSYGHGSPSAGRF
jgi:MFS family permease